MTTQFTGAVPIPEPDGLIWHTTGNPQWDGACWVVLDEECEPADDVHHATEASARAAIATTPGGKWIRRHQCLCTRPEWHGGPRPRTEDQR